jgi:uncharacterized protein (DUF1697 family)
MTAYITLLRGINVGGRNALPMRELVALLEALGLRNVQTYIQSGNVVFETDRADAARLAEGISASVQRSHGFRPHVLILGKPEIESAIKANPFPEAVDHPRSLHLFFLASAPQEPDLASLERVRRHTERFALAGEVVYLHAPEGIGRSKLAARVERALGVPVTARHWRTVTKIADMTASLPGS